MSHLLSSVYRVVFQAIWHDIQRLVIEEHHRMTNLIARCYPNSNIQLEFTVEDLLTFFTETAHNSLQQ
jgi:exocyst complex component 1